jgi:adenylate cyclase, class 2
MDNLEIEAKFLEIDKNALIKKLQELGAEDKGEDKLSEMIFYDQTGDWLKTGRTFVRIRSSSKETLLTYKNHFDDSASGVTEIETKVQDAERMKGILEAVGLVMKRKQEKIRHKFLLDNVIIDIDTWPKIPAYVELEGQSEEDLKNLADKLGFEWDKAVFGLAGEVIESYKIPILELKYYMFDKIE